MKLVKDQLQTLPSVLKHIESKITKLDLSKTELEKAQKNLDILDHHITSENYILLDDDYVNMWELQAVIDYARGDLKSSQSIVKEVTQRYGQILFKTKIVNEIADGLVENNVVQDNQSLESENSSSKLSVSNQDIDGREKSKTTAVVLAVFFGLFSWLYTYQKNKEKFWINLGLFIITFTYWGIVAWVWAIIDNALKPEEYFTGYYYPDNTKIKKPTKNYDKSKTDVLGIASIVAAVTLPLVGLVLGIIGLKKSKKQGYSPSLSIIGVCISFVWTTLSLIFLIVFLAVPTLQRNNRNTQRRSDATYISAAINEYISNNNGSLPTTWGNIKPSLVNMSNDANLPDAATAIQPATANQTVPDSSTAPVVATFGTCQTEGDNSGMAQTGGSLRDYVVLYKIENGGTDIAQCISG